MAEGNKKDELHGSIAAAFQVLDFDPKSSQYIELSQAPVDAQLAEKNFDEIRAMRSALDCHPTIHNVGVFYLMGGFTNISTGSPAKYYNLRFFELFVQRARIHWYLLKLHITDVFNFRFRDAKQMDLYLVTKDQLDSNEKFEECLEFLKLCNRYFTVPRDAELDRRITEELEALESGQAKLREEAEETDDGDDDDDDDRDITEGEENERVSEPTIDDSSQLSKEMIALMEYAAAKLWCQKLGLGLKGFKQLKMNLEEYLKETNEASTEKKLLKKLNAQFDQMSVAVTSVRII